MSNIITLHHDDFMKIEYTEPVQQQDLVYRYADQSVIARYKVVMIGQYYRFWSLENYDIGQQLEIVGREKMLTGYEIDDKIKIRSRTEEIVAYVGDYTTPIYSYTVKAKEHELSGIDGGFRWCWHVGTDWGYCSPDRISD